MQRLTCDGLRIIFNKQSENDKICTQCRSSAPLCFHVAGKSVNLISKAGITLAKTKYINGFNEYFPEEPGDDVHFVNQTGLAGGVALEIGLMKNNVLALQPEVLFVQKGGTMKAYNSYVRFYEETRYRLNYLEIPLLIKASLPLNGFKLYAHAGPSLAIHPV